MSSIIIDRVKLMGYVEALKTAENTIRVQRQSIEEILRRFDMEQQLKDRC